MTNPCCGLVVIFCGFISLLIDRETINIPEIFSGVHGFTGKTVSGCLWEVINSSFKGLGYSTDCFELSCIDLKWFELSRVKL